MNVSSLNCTSRVYRDLLDARGPDAWLITVNERLARFLWQAELKPGQVISQATIQSWQSLSHNLWKQVQWLIPNAPSLMSAEQSLFLWQNIIDQNSESSLLFSGETAKLAREAWVMHKKWKIPTTELKDYGAAPGFIAWCEAFEKKCQALHFHDEADLLSLLIAACEEVKPLLPSKLKFIGFDDVPPALGDWISLLNQQGIQAEFWAAPSCQKSTTQVYAALNREDEFYYACAQAKDFLACNDQASVAIVVPDLEIERASILKIAQTIFLDPCNLSPLSQAYSEVSAWPFTISGGESLLAVPVIAQAVLSLKLPLSQDYTDWSVWIRSAFITGAMIEKKQRLDLDLALRKQLNQKIFFEQMLQSIGEFADLTELKSVLLAFKRLDLNQAHSFAQWRTLIYQILDQIGWPGEQVLESNAHQAIVHFYRVVDRLSQLDAVATPVLYSEYLKQLYLRLSQHSFSPESSTKARCHILGGLEASGLCFEQIWFCGLSDHIFPKEPSPNPFIPFVLARQYNIPRSSSTRELYFAKSMMQRFLISCDTLVLSYPMTDQGLPSTPSPLLASYGQSLGLKNFEKLEQKLFKQRPQLEMSHQGSVPPIQSEQLLSIQGGVGIIQSQSNCPFQAFAKYRLRAEALPELKNKIDLSTRGLLLHEILENIWKQLKTQDTLLQKTTAELRDLVSNLVAKTLKRFASRDVVMFAPSWCQIEQKRLSDLVESWLMLERERSCFRVVDLEKTLVLEVQGLPMTLRLDRVDELATGELIIIDYKTGAVSIQDWFGASFSAPQLPLYATVYEQAQGLAFAEVNPVSCRLVGVAARKNLDTLTFIAELDGADASSWSDQKQIWQSMTTEIVGQFIRGQAAVAPRSIEKSCRYCNLQTLCRIAEQERV